MVCQAGHHGFSRVCGCRERGCLIYSGPGGWGTGGGGDSVDKRGIARVHVGWTARHGGDPVPSSAKGLRLWRWRLSGGDGRQGRQAWSEGWRLSEGGEC